MSRNFVGIGLGPIQAGLFCLEAQRSRNFGSLTVLEVDRQKVRELRANDGRMVVNVAHATHIEPVEVRAVTILHPQDDYEETLLRLAAADELATAVPSVDFYDVGGQYGIASLLAQAMGSDKDRIVYTAENHSRAAERLRDQVRKYGLANDHIHCLNTVIGKMCRQTDDAEEMRDGGLEPYAGPGTSAIVVEPFNRILTTRLRSGVETGFTMFEAKADLEPYLAAKLYGHNAVHACIAYAGIERGLRTTADACRDDHVGGLARGALFDECLPALRHRYAQLDNPDFEAEALRRHGEDLLERIANPNLGDALARIGRDPRRKLGPDDRLCGAIKLALAAGITPRHLLAGARAAIRSYAARVAEVGGPGPDAGISLSGRLREVWHRDPQDATEERIFQLIGD